MPIGAYGAIGQALDGQDEGHAMARPIMIYWSSRSDR